MGIGIPSRVYHIRQEQFDVSLAELAKDVESVALKETEVRWQYYKVVDGMEVCTLSRELSIASHDGMPSDCITVAVVSLGNSQSERIFMKFDKAFARHHDSDWVRRRRARRR